MRSKQLKWQWHNTKHRTLTAYQSQQQAEQFDYSCLIGKYSCLIGKVTYIQDHINTNIMVLMDKQQLKSLWILSPLIHLMQQNKASRDFFVAAFDRKETLLRLIKQQKIDAKRYLKLTTAACEHTVSLVSRCAEQDLGRLKSRKEKLFVEKWFDEMIERAKVDQKEHYALYQRYLEFNQMRQLRVTSVQDIQKLRLAASKSKILLTKQRQKQKIDFDVTELISFRALDCKLDEYQRNYEAYQQLIDRKARLITLVQTKKLTHVSYKFHLEKYIAQNKIKNQQILYQTRKEYENLQLFHRGSIQSWFNQLYAQTKAEFSQQKQIWLSLKYPALYKNPNSYQLPRDNPIPDSRIINSDIVIQIPEAAVKELSSLKALDCLLEINRQNPLIYASLFVRKRQVCKELRHGNIDAERYCVLQQQELTKAKSEVLRQAMRSDLFRLKDACKGNLNDWLKMLLQDAERSYPQQEQIYRDFIARRRSSSLEQATNKRQQIQQFLKAMAVYESVLVYFKKNQIDYHSHEHLSKYERNKQDVYGYLEKHEEDEGYDVTNLIQELFPALTPFIFYDGQLSKYKTQAQAIIARLQTQKSTLNEFIQRIKRVSNTQNKQRALHQIDKCQEHIKYLRGWPHGAYQAFPSVTYEKIIKLNTDINKLQNNQVEIEIFKMQAIEQQLSLNVSLFQSGKGDHSFKAANGPAQIKFTAKLNEIQMKTVINGTAKYLTFKLFKKGFFGGHTLVAEQAIETEFKDFNTLLARVKLGKATVDCVVRVQRPKYLIQVQIDHLRIRVYPEYRHDPYIEEELIKKMLPYCNPSSSELMT